MPISLKFITQMAGKKFSPIAEEFSHVGYLCGCLSNVEHRCKEAVTDCPQNEGKPNQD